ncbi:hypothetical protein, conserved, partial [Eimeria acervulina]
VEESEELKGLNAEANGIIFILTLHFILSPPPGITPHQDLQKHPCDNLHASTTMEFRELERAHTGAQPGFFSSFSELPNPPMATKGQEFFSVQQGKREGEQVFIHDREQPQPPPQHYVPGKPSPLHYGVPLSDGYDAGVYAVSTALFGGAGSFKTIPIQFKSVFRRRRSGDCLSEWSNAFVTRVDPCECVPPEETFTPYEVARFKDQQGRTHTTLDFSP